MYKNVGKRIKGLVKIIVIVTTAAELIMLALSYYLFVNNVQWVTMFYINRNAMMDDAYGWSIVITSLMYLLVAAIIVAKNWLSGLFTYAYGHLVDNTDAMVRNEEQMIGKLNVLYYSLHGQSVPVRKTSP